jgi:hypothetical protein
MTIVEVLVAMGILLIGLTAVLGLLTTGAALSRSAALRTTAAAASEAVVADLAETLFPLEDPEAVFGGVGEPLDVVERVLPGEPNIVYSARARQNPERPLEYLVEVELAWRSAGVRRVRRFTTLMVRELAFGERLRRRFVEEAGASAPPPGEPRAPRTEEPR